MSADVVVGLGPVPAEQVLPELGEGVEFIADPGPEDLARARGAIVRAAVEVGQQQLETMPQLEVIARTGVGVDDVDVAAASRRGIPVAITPGTNTHAVAEGAFAHLLHLVKSLAPLTDLLRSGGWSERTQIPVGDLEDAVLGIVGYGRIGQRVARIAEAFGMEVIAFDPAVEIPEELRVSSLDELLEVSDAVTLHVPLLDSTQHMIDAAALARMKLGAVLVNVSRGGLVDEDAALAALESGRLGGIGLDSFEPEPPRHHRLYDHPRAVVTPHVMGLSVKASAATFAQAARAVRAVLEGGHPAASVAPGPHLNHVDDHR